MKQKQLKQQKQVPMNKILSKLFLSLCIAFIISSCGDNESVSNGVRPKIFISDSKMDTLLVKAINEGDDFAYSELSSYYMFEGNFTEFYYYALLMANKHEHPQAYYDLYYFLTEGIILDGVKINRGKRANNMALYYLMKSHELEYEWEHNNPINTIEEIFGEGNEFPNSNYYLNLMATDTLD